jgi:hypothetical protein
MMGFGDVMVPMGGDPMCLTDIQSAKVNQTKFGGPPMMRNAMGEVVVARPKTEYFPMMGMTRDWLGACFAGSLCLFFGSLWLYKDMLLLSFVIQLVFLPAWTAAILFSRYNRPSSTYFTTWWYFAVLLVQFFAGFATLYLYSWVKTDLEAREREECIKLDQGKMIFPRETASIVAYPCNCKLWDKDKDTVIKRFDNMHQIDIRANILCPSCKNRIDVILV